MSNACIIFVFTKLFIVTGLVPFAIGSETAGSITYPAARCGVTALRPTFGTVGRTGVMSISESLVIFNITLFFYYTLNVN
jgi:Asp-tRNA(Asn)/Glu-tRNA(Gln) amidotransferase A subunit family amidase